MTHTNHRLKRPEDQTEEFVLLSMAAQGHNNKNAAQKLLKVLDIVVSVDPSNVADDAQGGIYSGKTIDIIKRDINDNAYIGATFTSKDQTKTVLTKLKEADLGMSVVVTGNFKEVFKMCKEVGLKPNAVNISLGIFGKKDLLPDDDVLEITTMCGHSMISPNSVKHLINRVKNGVISPEAAAKELARPCTCGIFNVDRASDLLSKHCCKVKGV
ncbi:MAG: hypothetical protein PHI32_11195 [Dysgonamonadaceae bacterium]|nr:hypothetical protein [Dysgonamonadaceae bacterium]